MKLSEAERYIMSIIWDSNKALNLHDLDSIARKRYKKKWKLQTIATFMKRLRLKGFIRVEKIDRLSYYHPLVSKEEYAKIEIEDMAYDMFQNDIKALSEFVLSLILEDNE